MLLIYVSNCCDHYRAQICDVFVTDLTFAIKVRRFILECNTQNNATNLITELFDVSFE